MFVYFYGVLFVCSQSSVFVLVIIIQFLLQFLLISKFTQRGLREIFVGIPDGSVDWLFYVPDAKKTYISMEAAFDEDSASPMVLPNLIFYGTLRLRDTSVHTPMQDAEVETTATSVKHEEVYPEESLLLLPNLKES